MTVIKLISDTKTKKKNRKFIRRNKWKKLQDKKKKVNITAVYNYSKSTLTEAMENILNRGLNFCINPIKLNLSELLVDYKKFEKIKLDNSNIKILILVYNFFSKSTLEI